MAGYETNIFNIIPDLWKTLGNNPRNRELTDTLANVPVPLNPFSINRGVNTLSNVDINPIKQSYLDLAYGVNNPQNNRSAANQLANIGSGVLDVAPTLPVAKSGAKTLGKEVARQVETGTGLLGRNIVNPRDYLFIGENSEMWNTPLANKAIKLEKQGKTPEQIWAATGTVKGVDGRWRQEITDSSALFNTKLMLENKAKELESINENLKSTLPANTKQKDLFPKQLSAAKKDIKEQIAENDNLINKNFGLRYNYGQMADLAFEHPEMYKNYPNLKQIVIRQGADRGEGNFGEFRPSKFGSQIDINKAAIDRGMQNPDWGAESTALHEFQHGIQDIENFGAGTSPKYELGLLVDRKNELSNQIGELNKQMGLLAKDSPLQGDARNAYDMLMEQRMQLVPEYQLLDNPEKIQELAYKNYKNSSGEAESRLTQRRYMLNDKERRANFPYQYTGETGYGLDVPFSDLIVRKDYPDEMVRNGLLLP